MRCRGRPLPYWGCPCCDSVSWPLGGGLKGRAGAGFPELPCSVKARLKAEGRGGLDTDRRSRGGG